MWNDLKKVKNKAVTKGKVYFYINKTELCFYAEREIRTYDRPRCCNF